MLQYQEIKLPTLPKINANKFDHSNNNNLSRNIADSSIKSTLNQIKRQKQYYLSQKMKNYTQTSERPMGQNKYQINEIDPTKQQHLKNNKKKQKTIKSSLNRHQQLNANSIKDYLKYNSPFSKSQNQKYLFKSKFSLLGNKNIYSDDKNDSKILAKSHAKTNHHKNQNDLKQKSNYNYQINGQNLKRNNLEKISHYSDSKFSHYVDYTKKQNSKRENHVKSSMDINSQNKNYKKILNSEEKHYQRSQSNNQKSKSKFHHYTTVSNEINSQQKILSKSSNKLEKNVGIRFKMQQMKLLSTKKNQHMYLQDYLQILIQNIPERSSKRNQNNMRQLVGFLTEYNYFFLDLRQTITVWLLKMHPIKIFPGGRQIFQMGQSCQNFYLILHGKVKLYNLLTGMKIQCYTGDILCQELIFQKDNKRKRFQSAIAQKKTFLMEIKIDQFKKMKQQFQHFGYFNDLKIIMRIIKENYNWKKQLRQKNKKNID